MFSALVWPVTETRFKALTLDLWDTLVQEMPRKNPSLAELRVAEMRSQLSSYGYDYDADLMDRAYKLSGEYCDSVWAENRDMSTDEHLLYMLSSLDPLLANRLRREEYAAIRRTYAEALLRKPPALMEEVAQTLDTLSSRGYALGLISNTGRTPGSTLRIILERMDVARFFDSMVFSDEVLVRKPEKKIFMSALRELGSSPAEALHIGNDPKDDFEGARLAGMSSLLLDRAAERKKSPEVVHSIAELADLL